MPRARLRALAKVNLALYVLGRRGDGYHEIWTLMQTISLADELSFASAKDGRVELVVSGRAVPTGVDNLVVRAAELLRDRYSVPAGVRIHLKKVIPVGAGLGGGSSDAAATLVGLNEFWGLGLAQEELLDLAAEIGSDVPFFIVGGAAVCRGRGEVVEPLEVKETLWYVVVAPRQGIPTVSAYTQLRASSSLTNAPLDAKKIKESVSLGVAEEVRRWCRNDLEAVALQLSSDCARARDAMLSAGLPQARVSGSGSALFCVCGTGEEAKQYTERLREQQKGLRADIFVAHSVEAEASPVVCADRQRGSTEEDRCGNHRGSCQAGGAEAG